jgi:hypothetical protein
MDTKLEKYFENSKGVGVLATADRSGKVNAAVYARPHFMEDGTLAVIMRDRLTHANIQTNPHAAYLFMEEGPGYRGKRLYLTKLREDENSQLIDAINRRVYLADRDRRKESRFLVYFKIDKVLPLIGAGE